MNRTTKSIIINFLLTKRKDKKYDVILQMKNFLPRIRSKDKNYTNKIHGCISAVWVYCVKRNNILYIKGDSNVFIIQSLLTLIISFYNGINIKYLKKINFFNICIMIDLNKYLSIDRHDSVKKILSKIHSHI